MKIRAILATTVLLIPGPALADLSAEDVWASWKSLTEETGQRIEVADQSSSGGVLTLSGVTVTAETPEGDVVTQVDEITMTEQGDGTVAISVTPEYDMRMNFVGEDDTTMDMAMRLVHTDLSVVASGDPDAISYDIAAPNLELALTEMVVDGEPADIDLVVGMEAVTGTYNVAAGDPQTIDSQFAAGALAVTVSVDEPEEDAVFDLAMTIENIESVSTGTLSPFAGSQDMVALLRQGLSTEGRASYGNAAYKMDGTGPDGQFIVEGSAASGTLDFSLNEDGLSYGGGNTDVAMNIVAPGAMMPPITVQIAQSEASLSMPLLASEETQNFGLQLQLSGVDPGEMLWSMVDPTGGLPRDPANLALDLTGKGNWMVDITDPEAMAELEDSMEMPGEIDSVDINALALSLAGAELTGSGAFTFNNEVAPPAPAGTLDLQLIGANTLIDKLISIGLLPEEQAMGARMMLGMFARPGSGEDTLLSTIELKEDGAVIANGQRIR